MKLKFKVSKLANQFFYISTLTNWSNSLFRQETKNEWNKLMGPLSGEEKIAIDNVEKILINYQRTRDKWLQNIFYLFDKEDQIWNWIKNNYTSEEYLNLKQAFKITKPKFNRLWKRVNRNKLNQFLNDLGKYCDKKLLKEMKKYFKFKEWGKTNIYVTVCPIVIGEGVAGHAWGNKDLIINIEISNLGSGIKNVPETALLISHEIFHSIFSRTKCLEIFKEEISKNDIDKIMPNSLVLSNFYGRPFVLVEESMATTFCDFYYLRAKIGEIAGLTKDIALLFNKDGSFVIQDKINKRKYLSRNEILMYIGYKMFPMVLSYIHKDKTIDRDLIRLFIKEVREILKLETIQ